MPHAHQRGGAEASADRVRSHMGRVGLAAGLGQAIIAGAFVTGDFCTTSGQGLEDLTCWQE